MKTKAMEGPALATLGTRFVALLIDGLVLAIAQGLLTLLARDSGPIGLIIGFAYHWYFLTRMDGQTPGKRILGIRVIKIDGSAISDSDALLRYLIQLAGAMVFMLGYIWAFFDDRQQTWHDKVANTIVVKA